MAFNYTKLIFTEVPENIVKTETLQPTIEPEQKKQSESVIEKFRLNAENIIHQSFNEKCSDYIADILSNRRDDKEE